MNVLMFHSVGNNNSNWHQRWLSVSLEHFEEFCKYLQKKNYTTIFLDEWYSLQITKEAKNDKYIALTFDDGYLDNWVFAYPILKKYGLKGTIFVNPEFIDPGKTLRYNLEDVRNGQINKEKLFTLGFLNWKEIQTMDKTNVIDIQSHTMSHNYYFKSDRLIDYYEGQDDYHWLPWILEPEKKPFWITEDQKNLVPEGYPLFEYGRALGLRRFFPSEKFIQHFIKEYEQLEKNAKKNDIKNQLNDFTQSFKNKNGNIGVYETDEEMEKRYKYEIFESKRILQEKLNKNIDFLCWPGGGYNDFAIKLSNEAGYKASTIASWETNESIITPAHYFRISRTSLGSFSLIGGRRIYNNNRKHLIRLFLSKRGFMFYKNMYRGIKYFRIFLNIFR